MKTESNIKNYVLKLERHPQKDFIERRGVGLDQTSAVKSILDNYFAEHKNQKVKIVQCLEVVV